ncbi:MAG: ABC transporter ATP-binding protein [Oscillospiraceae bacterium]|jgi:ATP-binding cassette subfamily B multidrug efflux pump
MIEKSHLGRLLQCLREYKRDTLLAPALVSIEVLLEVMIPFLMAKLIDKGITAGNRTYIIGMGVTLIVICCFSLLTGALSGKFAAQAAAGFSKNLRHDMYYNVQDFAFSNIDKFSTASIITRLTTDVTNVQQAFMMVIRMAVRSPIMMIFSLVAAFTINAKVAVIFLLAIPILAVGLFYLMTHAYPIFEYVFHTYDHLNNIVQENLHGIRVVKAFVREKHEIKKFDDISIDISNQFIKAEKLLAFNSPLMMICSYGCLLGASWLGAKMIVGGSMTTGELSSVISYSMSILMSLMMLSMVFVMITISRTSVERIVEVLNETSDLTNGENPVYSVRDGSISFENVNFSYANDENKLCLSDVNLSIRSGETIGIIGGTGTSKSSLVQLIPRLYDVTSGCVKVGGVDVRDYDLETLRNAVAMVLQKNVLFSGTIRENLRWGDADATDEEIVHACKLAQADDFIQGFPDGYDTYIEQGGTNVSGGQKQRLCIARALLKKPKILILDDSTSAVDTKTDAQIRRAFREEIPNTTKIIIAQRISSVEDADRILVLENGCINGVGTHAELLESNAIYREVYESQGKGGNGHEE